MNNNIVVRNIPIGCPKCGTSVRGKENQSTRGNQIVTECQWRCSRCGTFIKHGITKIDEK
jgi:uncharacterized Zn finger protein